MPKPTDISSYALMVLRSVSEELKGNHYPDIALIPRVINVRVEDFSQPEMVGKILAAGIVASGHTHNVLLEIPKAVESGGWLRDPATNLSIRFVTFWDPLHSKLVHDIAFALATPSQ